jgi:hypothetical protein
MRYAAAASAALALFFATPALADPNAACIWGVLSAEDQGAVATVVMQGGDMDQSLAERVIAAARGCGFEAGESGDYRASFLVGLYVHRLGAERLLMATSQLTSAGLDTVWANLDPAFKNSLRAYVISRYQRRDVPLPDAARLQALATQMRLSGDGLAALRNYLLLRTTSEYVESEGAAFRAAPAAPPAPAPDEAQRTQ